VYGIDSINMMPFVTVITIIVTIMKSCTKGIGEADPWDFGWSICVASAGLP
jgi:hypothetical protein